MDDIDTYEKNCIGCSMKSSDIVNISKKLGIPGNILGFSILSSGHINSTFKVDVLNNDKVSSYIIQKINTYVFSNPEALMKNILSVTEFIRDKVKDNQQVQVLNFLRGENGRGFVNYDGSYYRGYEFIKDSETYDITNNKDIIFETGYAFGEFQRQLGDFPAQALYETIPNFHNTPSRFKDFENAVRNDAAGRVHDVKDEIYCTLSLKNKASVMHQKYLAGELPTRVTHNDTKSNNVLFDKNTQKHICVIDLDTVMPGLAGFDFGDGVRFIASSATEDEKDLSKVHLDMDKFKSFTEGFLAGAEDVFTQKELETLPLGAITITAECGSRFLADYLNGDKYFKIDYPEHNLDRARCHLKLALDMIEKQSMMNQVVQKCAHQYGNEIILDSI